MKPGKRAGTGVKLGIFRGAELPDPNSPADLKRPGLKTLLQAALKAWRVRSAVASA